ncbi:MAG TPA: PH domain-containing protein, partial [Enhygromyxa sp.]|nr:PH domain-containing protein [Enhygromyxa sp.]
RFGLVRSRLRYAEIRRVVPTRSMLSSPALSMDRLHVDAGSSLGPLISPRDKSGFLDALAAKAPQLVREGDSLVPRP